MKGLKKAKTPEEIAKENDVPLEDVIRQLQMGVNVEKEHTISAKEYASQQNQNVASPTLGDIFKQQMEK